MKMIDELLRDPKADALLRLLKYRWEESGHRVFVFNAEKAAELLFMPRGDFCNLVAAMDGAGLLRAIPISKIAGYEIVLLDPQQPRDNHCTGLYPLFEYMNDAHGLTLTDSELYGIVFAARRCKVEPNEPTD